MSNTARAGSSYMPPKIFNFPLRLSFVFFFLHAIECFFFTFSFIWQSRNWTPSCITRLTNEPYLVSVEALPIVYLGLAVAITRLTSKPCLVYVRLFTVPNVFVRSFRYTASYRHGYLDFQMCRGDGRPKPPPPPK